MHLDAKPNFSDRASKLKSFPFLLAAFSLTIGSPVSAQSEQLDFGPQFKTVLAVARLNADCYGRQPCVVPSRPSQLLQQEIDGAGWIGIGGGEYVDGYQNGLARYLIEQKVRLQIDPNFSAADRGRAELALNTLGGYWDCLDRHIRLADESELATDAALDGLAEGASDNCSEHRVQAMTRIAPDAPDFAKFNPIRDGGLSNAGIAEVLHAIQRFAVAYNAGLRGYRHGHAIELIPLPAPIVAQLSPTASPLATPATPRAVEAFTLSNDDCVSVHADGDPWSECGFQSFAVSPDGTRVLTVSARGTTQLWNERGEEIRKVVWSDQPGGASGYPDGRTLIFGQYAIAVVHQNQTVVLDLASGEILAQNATDAMLIDELRPGTVNSALVGFMLWDWHGRRAAELSLPDGQLQEVENLDDLRRAGPGYWVSGRQAPFTLHRPDRTPTELSLERSCMPINERYCSWRDIPGQSVHVLSIETGEWSSFDLGRIFSGQESIEVVPAGDTLFAVICGRAIYYVPTIKPCSIRNLREGGELHQFQATRYRTAGFVSSSGLAEIRLTIQTGDEWRTITVTEDGNAYTLAEDEGAWLGSPDGNLLVSRGDDQSALTTPRGEELVQFPFSARSCGIGWPNWSTQCRIAANGRRWLVARRPPSDSQDNQLALTMYEVPSRLEVPATAPDQNPK